MSDKKNHRRTRQRARKAYDPVHRDQRGWSEKHWRQRAKAGKVDPFEEDMRESGPRSDAPPRRPKPPRPRHTKAVEAHMALSALLKTYAHLWFSAWGGGWW